jgi:hypothetical protein
MGCGREEASAVCLRFLVKVMADIPEGEAKKEGNGDGSDGIEIRRSTCMLRDAGQRVKPDRHAIANLYPN